LSTHFSEQNYRRWITESLLKYMLEKKDGEKTKIEAVIWSNWKTADTTERSLSCALCDGAEQ
jgi:hypothetical protein